MADCVELKDLFIGVLDGAMEAQNENFKELFYDPNSKYDELINNDEKFLVIGNKGTGKTYLANYILAKSPKGRVYEIVESSIVSQKSRIYIAVYESHISNEKCNILL